MFYHRIKRGKHIRCKVSVVAILLSMIVTNSTAPMEAGLNNDSCQQLPTDSDEQYAVMSQLERQIKQISEQIEVFT